jgi:hypothetical protein
VLRRLGGFDRTFLNFLVTVPGRELLKLEWGLSGVEKFLPHSCRGALSLSSRRWTTAEKSSMTAGRNELERNYLGCSLNDGHNRLAGHPRCAKLLALALDIPGE